MFRIKSLILLLSSLIIVTCARSYNSDDIKLSVGYVGGEYDGLFLSNRLKSHLNNFGMLDLSSNLEVRSNISHSSNLFVTNIDNTSDRERVTSKIKLRIYDKRKKCVTYSHSETISQFYVLAKSDKFTSNVVAVSNIKSQNTDNLIKKFINNLSKKDLVCKIKILKDNMVKIRK